MWAQSASTITSDRIFVAGDVVIVNLDPARGSEQSGVRPALVISSVVMQEVFKRIVICPITRNMGEWPTKIRIPNGYKTIGMVLTDQVRSLDHKQRVLRITEALLPIS